MEALFMSVSFLTNFLKVLDLNCSLKNEMALKGGGIEKDCMAARFCCLFILFTI